jgi:hypothetical protein
VKILITSKKMQFVSSILFFVLVLGTYVSTVRIGSFNLKQYGSKKAADASVTNTMATILNDFDLAIIQEITDVTLKAPYVLYEALNSVSKTKPYSMVLSERVGRSASKEQYIFFNRESTSGVQLVQAHLYDDKLDYFERPP